MFKIPKDIIRYLSKEDVKIILAHTKKTKPEMYRIIKFALFTGCRREEIIKARYEHIKGNEIKIFGKGGKQRLIELLPQALEEKQDIGKIFSYKHVSTISNYFRKLARECNIKARFHDLRHYVESYIMERKPAIILLIGCKFLKHSP
ncbi:MAG: tyrosine-type recombinase/integrase [Deltaproteobacteria bacterium]|jgi:integrase|nr:tyrosine-type recombinase/integrase [Deltaproteobacteria bacterium]